MDKELTDEQRKRLYIRSTIRAGLIVSVILFVIIMFFSLKWALIISIGYTLAYYFNEFVLHKPKF